jgi:hypothetical protein
MVLRQAMEMCFLRMDSKEVGLKKLQEHKETMVTRINLKKRAEEITRTQGNNGN